MDDAFKTTELHSLVDRMQAGDREAENELIRRSASRLEGFARRMLKDFPSVRRWEQTGDVLQNALARFLKTLRHVKPDSTTGHFRLGAQAIRRELIDMARRYRGPGHTVPNGEQLNESSSSDHPPHPAADPDEVASFDKWAAFHEEVELLDEAERLLVELRYYQGLAWEEVAKLMQTSVKTVRRRWDEVIAQLAKRLGADVPG